MQLSHHFLILSREGAENYRLEVPHVCISVRDPESNKASLYPNLARLDALYLEFHDLDEPLPGMSEDVVFNQEHVKNILGFYRRWVKQVDGFVINCEAGISRSAAVGAALAKITGYDDSLFFKKFCPNRRVYRMLLNEWYSSEVAG